MLGESRAGRVRRIANLLIAAALSMTAGFLFLRAMDRPALKGPISFGPKATVWPENALSVGMSLEVIQREASFDRGSMWRLVPRKVVARFADEVLGWGNVRISGGGEPEPDGTIIFTVTTDSTCGLPTAPCPGRAPPDLQVTLVQPLGEQPLGGIWSVSEVESPSLTLPDVQGHLAGGQALAVGIDMAKTEHAVVGAAYVDECGRTTFDSRVGIRESANALEIPDPLFTSGPACSGSANGYLFAYTTPQLVVQTGDPFLESASLNDLAIVAVSVSQAGTSPAPSGEIAACGEPIANLSLGADGLRFDRDCLVAPARTPITIGFDNRDAGESHNVAIYDWKSCFGIAVRTGAGDCSVSPASQALFTGGLIVGPDFAAYALPGLAPGRYVFLCDVHPYMHGIYRTA